MWRTETINDRMQFTLREMHGSGVLAGFYLAGGTGLALHLGHRRSHDFHFFSQQSVDEKSIIHRLSRIAGFGLTSTEYQTVHAVIGETKVSFLAYDYPLLFELADLSGTPIADPIDIACMKLSAVASRGTKRDFVDLYVAAREFGLQKLIELFHQKYARVRFNGVHLLKSLGYFADADVEPMPDMLMPLEWEEVKSYFQTEVTRLL